ncbi:MAG: hypothetical protein IID41_00500 [Planctomycetes bacterium]|nr:hypothetical protein [Planctomycetota bacterium]
MAKRIVATAIKLLRWQSHHEPRRFVAGGLSYYLESVHSGAGYDGLVEKHGAERAMTILGFFNLLEQRTAQLRREWRGYVLDGAHRPATVALLAQEYQLSRPRVEGLLKALTDVGWLGRRPLRRLLRKPSVAHQTMTDTDDHDHDYETETETADQRSTTKKLAAIDTSGSGSEKLNLSDSGSRTTAARMVRDLELHNAAEHIAKRLNVTPPESHPEESNRRKQSVADLVTISKAVHHRRGDPASIETLQRLAAEVAEGTRIRKPVAAWIKRVKNAGLFYKPNDELQSEVMP